MLKQKTTTRYWKQKQNDFLIDSARKKVKLLISLSGRQNWQIQTTVSVRSRKNLFTAEFNQFSCQTHSSKVIMISPQCLYYFLHLNFLKLLCENVCEHWNYTLTKVFKVMINKVDHFIEHDLAICRCTRLVCWIDLR